MLQNEKKSSFFVLFRLHYLFKTTFSNSLSIFDRDMYTSENGSYLRFGSFGSRSTVHMPVTSILPLLLNDCVYVSGSSIKKILCRAHNPKLNIWSPLVCPLPNSAATSSFCPFSSSAAISWQHQVVNVEKNHSIIAFIAPFRATLNTSSSTKALLASNSVQGILFLPKSTPASTGVHIKHICSSRGREIGDLIQVCWLPFALIFPVP